MGVSMFDVQHDAFLFAIRDAGRGRWKVLIVDEASWRLINGVVKEDEILSEHITNIEHIEQKRTPQRDTDAIYILTPEPHIVDCLMADLEKKKYRQASLLWTSLLPPPLRDRIDKSRKTQDQIAQFQVLDVGFFPRESTLVTFRDPWSFPILFHPGCNHLVRQHITDLAQKIVSVCVSLGEYPTIRYYRPRTAEHEANVLCSHLARFVQEQIDMYATYHNDFPPASSRPRGTLYILDRSMDVIAPLVHEFTYQAMIHELLPIKDGDRVTYKVQVNEGRPDQEEKELEITEKDKIWITNRHQHMKDTIERLMSDFQKFMDDNPHFTKADASNATSLNAIKDMMAGLPQFQEMKEAYSLHFTMAQECMSIFQQRKLADLASIEQSLATGLDEDYKKPKNMADQVVRALDEDSIDHADRLRLIMLYLLFRDGLLPADTNKLLAHAQLAPQDGEVVQNLNRLGVRIERPLKDTRPAPQPLFSRKAPPPNTQDNYSLSRFDPLLKPLLEEHAKGVLDQNNFPYTKPQLEAGDSILTSDNTNHASLRSAKPTWAKTRTVTNEARQRVLIFMAGGATYSESRTCYEASRDLNKDVYLITTHMQTPQLFIRQMGDLSADRRNLRLPVEQPKPKAPAHIFEPEQPEQPPIQQQQQRQPAPTTSRQPAVPTSQMSHMHIGATGTAVRPQNGNTTSTSSKPSNAPEAKKKSRFGKFGLK